LKGLPESVILESMKRMTFKFDYVYSIKNIVSTYIDIMSKINPVVKEKKDFQEFFAQ